MDTAALAQVSTKSTLATTITITIATTTNNNAAAAAATTDRSPPHQIHGHHQAVAASSARRAAAAPPRPASEPEPAVVPRTPLSNHERLSLAAWVLKWRKLHEKCPVKSKTGAAAPLVTELACLEGPMAAEIIGHAAPALMRVLSRAPSRSTVDERRRCLQPSHFGQLTDVLIGTVMSYQTIQDLNYAGMACPAFRDAPSQHYLRNAIAGPLAETLALSVSAPAPPEEEDDARRERFEEVGGRARRAGPTNESISHVLLFKYPPSHSPRPQTPPPLRPSSS